MSQYWPSAEGSRVTARPSRTPVTARTRSASVITAIFKLHLLRKALWREELNGMRRLAGQRELGHRFAQHRCEFETVSRETGSERNLRVFRMQADNEMFIGRHCVHAHGMQPTLFGNTRQKFSQAGFNVLLIRHVE